MKYLYKYFELAFVFIFSVFILVAALAIVCTFVVIIIFYFLIFKCVTLDHKTSLKSLGYICNKIQQYIV